MKTFLKNTIVLGGGLIVGALILSLQGQTRNEIVNDKILPSQGSSFNSNLDKELNKTTKFEIGPIPNQELTLNEKKVAVGVVAYGWIYTNVCGNQLRDEWVRKFKPYTSRVTESDLPQVNSQIEVGKTMVKTLGQQIFCEGIYQTLENGNLDTVH